MVMDPTWKITEKKKQPVVKAANRNNNNCLAKRFPFNVACNFVSAECHAVLIVSLANQDLKVIFLNQYLVGITLQKRFLKCRTLNVLF